MSAQVQKVVIADDEMMVRQVLKIIFDGEDNFEVVGEATNGQEAVTLCRKHRPGLLCLDILMPKMDGLEALKQLAEEFPDMTVVMISGDATSKKVIEAIGLGAKGFIVKPFSATQVQERIRALA